MASPFELLDPRLGDELVEAAGRPAFGSLLLQAAQRIDDVTEVFGYRLAPDRKPQPLLSCSQHDDAQRRTDEYVSRFYRNDPALWARRGVLRGGYVEHVRASDIALRDYRSICFDRPRFADKLCYGWRHADEEFVLSFYRKRDGALGDVRLLAGLANVALTALVRAGRSVLADGVATEGGVALIEERLAARHPKLSGREREICARTLAGRTARGIGEELGLSPGTVLTYRQRAYAKLGIASASALLPAVMH